MTTKEYLQQAYTLERQIKLDRLKLESMRISACGSSVNYEYTGGQNRQKNGFQIALDNIISYEACINGKIQMLIKKRQEIENVINDVQDFTQREILTRRYLLYQKWELIAVEMNYNIKHIYKLHKQALKNVRLNAT